MSCATDSVNSLLLNLTLVLHTTFLLNVPLRIFFFLIYDLFPSLQSFPHHCLAKLDSRDQYLHLRQKDTMAWKFLISSTTLWDIFQAFFWCHSSKQSNPSQNIQKILWEPELGSCSSQKPTKVFERIGGGAIISKLSAIQKFPKLGLRGYMGILRYVFPKFKIVQIIL